MQNVQAQKPVLSKEEALEDLEYLHVYMKKWHPSYLRYASPATYDSLYNHFASYEDDSITYRAFRYFVSSWVKQIRCGHTAVGHASFPVKNKTPKVIPLNIWFCQGKLYVRDVLLENSKLQRGDEITSIQGNSSSVIIDTLSTVITGDGYQETHVQSMLEKYFLFYFNHVFGSLDSVSITTINGSGIEVSDTLSGIEPPANKNRPERFPMDSSSVLFQGGGMSLHTLEGLTDTYLLKVSSFGSGSQSKVRRKIFKYLKRKDAKNVVLDLRGNGGGNVFRGYALAEQLLPEASLKVQFGKKIHTAIFDDKFEMDLGSRFSGVSFMLNPWQYPKNGIWMHYFPVLTSHKNRFSGNVFVLVDGGTFSMGSTLASLMKYKRNALMIGEESGGSEFGSGGMLSGAIRLPNSGIPVTFNLYWFQIDGAPFDKGRGVIPHKATHYTIQDRLSGRDIDLEWTLQQLTE